MAERPKGTVAAEVVLRDGEVRLQRPERPKPGDRVLVPAIVVDDDGDGPRYAFEGWTLYLSGEGVVAHPGCDPALIPKLVEAAREYRGALVEEEEALADGPADDNNPYEIAAFNRTMERIAARIVAARDALLDLAAQLDADEGPTP